MFLKKQDIRLLGRLKKRSDFLCVQQHAQTQKWVSKSMIIELCPNENLGLRYGLTVSKRVSKLAVARNRTKRRLRAAVCDVLPKYHQHNIDLVLIGRISTAEQDYETLKKDLKWCLKRMGYHENENTAD